MLNFSHSCSFVFLGRESDKREERKKDEKVLLYLGNMPSNVTKVRIVVQGYVSNLKWILSKIAKNATKVAFFG